ncbi:sensor histidine kinase [Vaginisenegalia massiliensis]|uniref:sensor histidine kinase n=1 Tax=Vaginisenegalia massiliensis TaxID=2058294 RepID=UPI000F5248AE|nr:sensor histidine kinase [Vaginisenegalia massiliensis]
MNLRLWLRLFLHQFALITLIILILVGTFVYAFDDLTWQSLVELHYFKTPFYLLLMAFSVALAAVYAGYLSHALTAPYEQVRARINWLLLGKYKHPIFANKVYLKSWYDSDTILLSDVTRLRDKLVQLSTDLQAFSASPTFVGEETKEEIIEEERHRIARELHDSVSQQLFAAMMLMSAANQLAQKDSSPKLKQQLAKVEEIISNAQTEMRALLLHLRPIGLEGRSLKQGITQLLMELKTKVDMDMIWQLDETKFESGIEDHLFRIVQEVLSNTLRHSKASQLEVYLREANATIQLKIVDNGVGFDTSQPEKLGSYGLRNIKERVTSLGGTCKIMSIIGQGTVVDIMVPLKPIFEDENIPAKHEDEEEM